MSTKPESGMGWSLHLGRWLGIDVYLHITFLLLLAFIGVPSIIADLRSGRGIAT